MSCRFKNAALFRSFWLKMDPPNVPDRTSEATKDILNGFFMQQSFLWAKC